MGAFYENACCPATVSLFDRACIPGIESKIWEGGYQTSNCSLHVLFVKFQTRRSTGVWSDERNLVFIDCHSHELLYLSTHRLSVKKHRNHFWYGVFWRVQCRKDCR